MKYPLWIINIVLIGIIVCSFVIFKIIKRSTSFTVSSHTLAVAQPPSKVMNVIHKEIIYNNDIFGTYNEQQSMPPTPTVLAVPKPPLPKELRPVVKPVPHFLPPLALNLKGVMALATEQDNIAIIEDSQSKITKNYKVGDKIGDGYVLRIARNAFSVLRSNGQQETLYVNSKDPELLYLLQGQDWSTVIKHQQDNSYIVYYQEFIKYVPHVAKFVELFNLSTVYKDGKQIGCRIGKPPEYALLVAAGLKVGDIIVSIDHMPLGNVEQRLALLDHVSRLDSQATLVVDFIRNNKKYRSLYVLKNSQTNPLEQPIALLDSIYEEQSQHNKQKVLKERYLFASQLQRQKNHDKDVHDTYQQQLRRGQGNISAHVRTS